MRWPLIPVAALFVVALLPVVADPLRASAPAEPDLRTVAAPVVPGPWSVAGSSRTGSPEIDEAADVVAAGGAFTVVGSTESADLHGDGAPPEETGPRDAFITTVGDPGAGLPATDQFGGPGAQEARGAAHGTWGTVVAGSSIVDPGGPERAWVRHYDDDGELAWESDAEGAFEDVAVLRDRVFAVGSSRASGDRELYVAVFDLGTGDLLDERRWLAADSATLTSVAAFGDELVVGGYYGEPDDAQVPWAGYHDGLLESLDAATLETNWTRRHAEAGFDAIFDVEVERGEFFYAGMASRPTRTALVGRLSDGGLALWERETPLPAGGQAYALSVAPDRSVVIAGSLGYFDEETHSPTHSDAFVQQISNLGQLEQTITWGTESTDESFTAAARSRGRIVLVGVQADVDPEAPSPQTDVLTVVLSRVAFEALTNPAAREVRRGRLGRGLVMLQNVGGEAVRLVVRPCSSSPSAKVRVRPFAGGPLRRTLVTPTMAPGTRYKVHVGYRPRRDAPLGPVRCVTTISVKGEPSLRDTKKVRYVVLR